jgi:hypothetical protein
MKKLEKSKKKMSDGLLSAAILARRRRPVASVIDLDTLRWAMRLVTYRRTDRASKTANKYGSFLSFFLWHSNPLSVRGPGQYGPNTRPMVASPVALGEALNPLYRSILAVSRRRMNSSVKMGQTEVHLFVVDNFGINLNVAY